VAQKPGNAGLKEGLETAAMAAAGGAALQVAGKLGRRVTEKVKDVIETQKEDREPARQA
jgi:hypothetical protein